MKVVDFGIARLLHPEGSRDLATDTLDAEHPGATLVRGTAPYMSPEQILGNHVDERSDIFACGAMLYEMVSARRAFEAPTAVGTMAAVLECKPRPLHECDPHVPRVYARVVERCLQKAAAARFQSAVDLKFALDAVCEDLAPPAPRSAVSAAEPAGAASHAHGRRMRSAAALVPVAAALALAAWALEPTRSAEAPRVISHLAITGLPLAGMDIAEGDRVLTITPDGTCVVFAGNHGRQLFVRHLARAPAEPLTALSGGVRAPFISPDGPDGQRFLMLKDAASSPHMVDQIVVVQNWAEDVARLLGAR